MFMQQGGEKDLNKVLAGGVQYGLDKEKPVAVPNTEVEDGEWILDSQGLRVVEGEKHKDGGTDVVLEDGAKVLSNFTKIPAKLARSLSKEYKIKVKASDTYAQALEKVYKSLGLNTMQDEQKALIDKIEKQQKETKDETTYEANLQAISYELNEIEDQKKPLLEVAIDVFQELFSDQESHKPDEKVEEGFMQEGGTFKYRRTNQYENPDLYTHQSEGSQGGYGTIGKIAARKEYETLFPNTTQTYFGDSIIPQNPGEFQRGLYENYYPSVTKYAEGLYGKDSDMYKQYADSVSKTTFTDDQLVSGLDSKYGNYTSTRSAYSFPVIPQDVYSKLEQEGVNTFGQLKGKYPDLYKQYIPNAESANDDFWLAPIEDNTKEEVRQEVEAEKETEKVNAETEVINRTGVFPMPDQSPIAPEGLTAHLKTNRRYERADYVELSPEQQLIELSKNIQRAANDLGYMPANQRAAVSANLLSTGSDMSNKILDQTSQINRQEFNRIQNVNNQIQMSEENASAQDALNFEQRQFLAKAKTESDIRNYFNTLQRNQVRNFNTINNLNLTNARHDDFQFTGLGVESKGPKYEFGQPSNGMTDEQQYKNALDVVERYKKQNKTNKRFGSYR